MNAKLFQALYEKTAQGCLTLWRLPDKKTFWYKATDYAPAYTDALKMSADHDVYFGICLRRRELTDGRGGQDEIMTVPCLYADLDIAGPAHAQSQLPQTREEAVGFLNSLPLTPSALVSSGNGLHAYWFLENPFIIANKQDSAHITAISEGFGQFINSEGAKRGWRLDKVSDLPRVLRVPGTINHKNGGTAKCEVFSFEEKRYPLEAFLEYKALYTPPMEREEIEATASGPASRILERCAFIQHCRDCAATLPEPEWYAMVTNLSLAQDGPALVHELSKGYPKYRKAETDRKIAHAVKEIKPHTCARIQKEFSFTCPQQCKVRSPLVHCLLTFEEQMQALLEQKTIDADAALQEPMLSVLAYAMNNMPAEYARFKLKLKNKVSSRELDGVVRAKANQYKSKAVTVEDTIMPLELRGIDLNGALQPANWNVTLENGVCKLFKAKNGVVIPDTVCHSAMVITARLSNVDSGDERIELAFFRDGKWKRFVADRSLVFNKNALIACTNRGLPITSNTTTDMVTYLSDYENLNESRIPLKKSVARLGWINATDFFPYTTSPDVIYEQSMKEAGELFEGIVETGDYSKWLETAKSARANPFARFILAVSFASPLVEKLGHRVFFVNVWHDSLSGKTAILKLAVAAWGNPLKIMGTFNATMVGIERMAGTLRNVVYALDEKQLLDERKMRASSFVFNLCNGGGKLRGGRDGGFQDFTNWRNIILTTAESPLVMEESDDGIESRVVEIHAKPTEIPAFAAEMHYVSERNYGFAGKQYIVWLKNRLLRDAQCCIKDFDMIMARLKGKYAQSKHLTNVAVVCLGDYYSDMAVFGADEQAALESSVAAAESVLENNTEYKQEADIVLRAWRYMQGWCAENERAFTDDAPVRFGVKTDERTYWIHTHEFDNALNKQNYPAEKCKIGFFERGYMKKHNGKRIRQKKLNGGAPWFYVLELPEHYGEGDVMPLSGESNQGGQKQKSEKPARKP